MTRVVVVHHDPDVAARQVAMLRTVGYEVDTCAGPIADPCPVLGDLPCPIADRADVLVYDAYAAGDSDGGRALVGHLRDLYVDLPLVLTAADDRLAWIETEGPARVTPLTGDPDVTRLRDAIETALGDAGMAV